jgi:hypothetical protein
MRFRKNVMRLKQRFRKNIISYRKRKNR